MGQSLKLWGALWGGGAFKFAIQSLLLFFFFSNGAFLKGNSTNRKRILAAISTTEKKKKKELILKHLMPAYWLHFRVYTGRPVTKISRCSVKGEGDLLGPKGWENEHLLLLRTAVFCPASLQSQIWSPLPPKQRCFRSIDSPAVPLTAVH